MGGEYGDHLGDWPGVYVMKRLLILLAVCTCAAAAAGAVQTVYAVSLPGDFSEDPPGDLPEDPPGDTSLLPGSVSSGDGIMPYSSYDTYYGSISSTYLEYMRGYLSKLPPDAHYVGARVGQYDYLFAYGAGLAYNGSTFSGAATVVRWNTYNNGTMYQTYDSAFYLNPGSYLVYSDLSGKYPSLATSSDVTLRQILILFTIYSLCLTIDHMYQVRKIRRLVRKENK